VNIVEWSVLFVNFSIVFVDGLVSTPRMLGKSSILYLEVAFGQDIPNARIWTFRPYTLRSRSTRSYWPSIIYYIFGLHNSIQAALRKHARGFQQTAKKGESPENLPV